MAQSPEDYVGRVVRILAEQGVGNEEIGRVLQKEGNALLPEPAGKPSVPLLDERLDLADLLGKKPPSIDWLVRGLVARGETVNLAAKWGVGKTWFALDLALAVADATRKEFLGRPVKHGRVVYLDEEGTVDIVWERLALLGALPEVTSDLVYLLNTGTKLTDKDSLERLRDAVASVGPELLVLDSLTRFYSGLDENNASDMASLTALVAPLSRDFGTTVLLLDHGPKAGSSDPSNAARGSGEKGAGVDRIWSLDGGEASLTLKHGKVRRGKTPPMLEFRRVTSDAAEDFTNGKVDWELGRIGVWHEVVGEGVAEPPGTDYSSLRDVLGKAGGRAPMAILVESGYGGRRYRAGRAVHQAVKDGVVRLEPDPKDGRAKIVVLNDTSPEAA